MSRAPFLIVALISTIALAAPGFAQQAQDTAKSPEPAKSSAAAPSDTANAPAAPGAAAPGAAAPAPAPKYEVHVIPAPNPAPDVPSADILRKARLAGYHTRVSHGAVYYCKNAVETGTRFTKEVCVDENQLTQSLLAEQQARDQFTNRACTGGCSGK
jgi:hypothetical protein